MTSWPPSTHHCEKCFHKGLAGRVVSVWQTQILTSNFRIYPARPWPLIGQWLKGRDYCPYARGTSRSEHPGCQVRWTFAWVKLTSLQPNVTWTHWTHEKGSLLLKSWKACNKANGIFCKFEAPQCKVHRALHSRKIYLYDLQQVMQKITDMSNSRSGTLQPATP